MAGQGQQGISVPISLQISNLQSIVNMLQSKLSNLKVGTAGFKSLQTIISTIQKDIDKLAIQTDKPFVNANQFTAADRAVNKLEEDLDKVQIAVSRIKFSDLELDPSQTAELKAFETQIESIKNSLKTVKETAKQAFLDSDVGKSWAENHKDATTQTLQQLTTTITREVQKQKTELDQAKDAFSDYQHAIQVSKNINNFMSKRSGHELSEATMGKELFDKIFKTDNAGEVLKFQNGGKTLLQQWLQQQFNLDSATVQSLTEGAGQAVVKAFAEIGGKVEAALKAQQIKLRNAATEQKTTTNNGSTLEAAVKEKAEKLNQTEAVQAQLVASNTSVSASEAQLRAELEQTKAQLADYKERLAQAVRTNPDWTASNKQANAALQQLRDTLSQTNTQFLQQQRVMSSFNSMKMAVVNFMGFNQVLNLTKTAVREAINHIKELDTVMNGIAIVTDMSTGDLWNQIDQYSKMAQAYGVSITGAYEVSQIYYQQGLETADVMTLTNETLKLAKISGLDYATTTDYMTTAIRGFKMEMSEASTVVDVYSNLAAHTAVSQEELAVAMSKTASSMEGVGATFEEASAMIGTMVAVTRESATNIGSAMKSIASRYGELTKDPTKLVDEEGEAMAFNKVDAALQSVGISMKTVDGQFREFTDVIVELGEKWNELDSTQQRYIATQFAGNRQQSRFLALVSNVDLLKSNLDVAMNSEDTGTLQALKALDSIESKIEQVKVAYQQFYTTIGAESVWKGLLDSTKNVINTLNGLPKLFGKIPIAAIGAISSVISLIKSIGIHLISGFAEIFGNGLLQGMNQAQTAATQGATTLWERIKEVFQEKQNEAESLGKALGESTAKGYSQNSTITAPLNLRQGLQDKFNNNSKIIDYYQTQVKGFAITDKDALTEAYQILGFNMQRAGMVSDELKEKLTSAPQQAQPLLEEYINSLIKGNNSLQHLSKSSTIWSNSLQTLGSALNMIALTIDTTAEGGKTLSGTIMSISGVMSLASAAIKGFSGRLKAIPWVAVASGAIALINGISTLIVNSEERLEELTKKAEDLSNKAKESKANYRTLDSSIKKIRELEAARYDSTEAAKEYQAAVDELADKFPLLIQGFDDAGNAILDASAMEGQLTEARQRAAEAAYEAAQAEAARAKQELENKQSDISGSIGNVRNLLKIGNTLASYKDDQEFWHHIGVNGGGNKSLYEQLLTTNKNNELNKTQEKLLSWLTSQSDYNRNNGVALTNLFSEALSAVSSGNYNKAVETVDMINMAYQTMDWKMPENLEKAISNLNTQIRELAPLSESIEMANKQAVNAYIRSSDYYNLPFIQNNSKLFSIAENQLYKAANGNFSRANLEIQGQDIFNSINLFWSTLSKNTQDTINTIFSNPEKYTKQDVESYFKSQNISLDSFPNWLLNIFDNQITNIKKTLNSKLDQIFDNTDDESYIKFADLLNKENQELTLSEQKFLVEVLNQIQDLNTQGFDSTKLSENAVNLITNLNKNLGPEMRETLLQQILTNGLSKEGLQKTLDFISNNTSFGEFSTDELINIMELTIPNIALSSEAVLSNFKEQWEEVNKLVSSLATGVEQKDIESTIQQAAQFGMNLSEDDFKAYGDKFIVQSTSISTFLNGMYTYYTQAFTNMETSLNTAYENMKNALWIEDEYPDLDISVTYLDNTTLDDLRTVLQSDFLTYFEFNEQLNQYVLKEGVTIDQVNQAIETAYQNGITSIDNLTNFFSNIVTNLEKTSAWKQGDYRSLLDTKAFKELAEDPIGWEKLNQRLFQLADINTQWTAAELDEPDIKNAVTKIRTAYSSFLTDVLNKGFDNIDLSQYEGLAGMANNLLEGSYTDFISTYISRAGLSISEANNLIVQAIEKDNALKSIDILKDFQYESKDRATATLSTLNEYASRVGVSIDEILNQAVISSNATLDEYVVDMTALSTLGKKLEIDEEELQAATQDSINSYWDNIVKLIQSGLNGQLSNADWQSLRRFSPDLAENGYTTGLEGLQLTDESFMTLYGTVSKTNKLLAKSLLPDLVKTSGRYKTLGDVLREFEETTDKARKDMLKDIASSMLREPDRYNLMGADLPTTWQIADNFYGSAYKGNQVIKGMQNGKVSASDFSAFMQSILDNSQNAEDRQWALEQLQNAPDYFFEEKGTLMVNTAKMGLTKYKQYYDIMVRAYDTVRKAGAKEQEIYNALFYGSESLQNADVYNEDGTVNSTKLLKLVDGKTKQGQDIKAALEKIQIGDQTLYDMLKSGEHKDTVNQMIQQLAKTNWDYENLDTQLEEYFSHYGGGTVTIDDVTGKIIFKASDSKEVTTEYDVGGKKLTREEYSKWLAARAKAGIKDTDITEENAANDIHYNLGQQEITVAIQADGKVTYTAKFANKTFVAETEEDLITALEAFDWVKPGASNSSSSVVREIIIDNVSYIINTDGTVTFKDSKTENADNEEIRKKLQEKFKKTPVEVEQDVEVTGTTQAKVNDLELTLAEGAKVTLNLANEILQLSQAIVSAEGTVNSLSITPTQILALINTLVPKLIGTLGSAEYGEALNAILTSVNASFSGIPNIDNIQLSDVSYLKPVAATLLTLSLLTNNDTKSSLDSTVTINDKDFTISSIVHALLNSLVLTSSDTGAVPTFAENFTINDTTLRWTEALNAIITQLNLTGTNVTTSQGEITLGEGENQVHLNTSIIGLVLGLLLNWETGANREPNMDALGIQTEYQAPDASITQNVSLKWNFTGEEAALNEMATEISNLINSSDLHLQNGAWQLDASTIAYEIRRKVQEYIAMGGQRYQFDKNGNVIEFAGELSTEEVEATKTELENDITTIPVETGKLDTSSVDNWQPKAKTIPVKTEMGNNAIKGHPGRVDGITYTAVAEGGPALAGGRKGKTLMGELGPELYVTNGKYYIAGQNGAEFVNLPDDAIVFNHLQTKKLLDKGYTINGKPFTSEGRAIGNAHATGKGQNIDINAIPTIESIFKFVDSAIVQPFINSAKAAETVRTAKELVTVQKRLDSIEKDNHIPLSAKAQANAVKTEEIKELKQTIIKQAKDRNIDLKTLAENKALDEDVAKQLSEIAKEQSKKQDAANTNLNNAADKLNQAAEAQTAAAKTQTAAAEATSGRRNEYGSQQESRGLVHPNGAYKLKDIFAGTASVGSGARASGTNIYKGTGNTLGREISQVLKTQITSAASGNTEVQKTLKEVKSAVSTFISDLLSQGIESIDLSKYDKLTKELTSEIQAKINKGDSYRSFIKAYAAAMDKSIHEINATYFEAWQKDLEKGGLAEKQLEAMEGLSFFNNGEIAGSADDWTTILGDAAFVGDAEEAGVLEWNAALRQYIARDKKALEEFMNTQLNAIWNFPDAIIDGAQSVTDEINELMEKAISGEGLTSKEKSRLEALLEKSNYIDTIEFNKNANGKFGITNASAAKIAASISGSDDTIVDESQKIAQNALSAIFDAVENSEITREMGNTIEQWLVAQGSSLEEMGIKKTDTGYSIGFDSIIKSIETFGKDNKDQIIQLLSGIDTSNLSDSELGQLESTLTTIFGDSTETLIASIKDNLIGRAKGIMDIISSGFGEGKSINQTQFTELSESLSKMGLNINDFTFGTDAEGNFTANWETIRQIYEQMITKYPEAAKAFIKNISDDELTADEKKAKADILEAAGDIKGANKVLDAMVSAAEQVTSTMAKAFGEGNYITNEEYINVNEFLKNAGHKELSLTQTSEGYIASFEDITEVFNDLIEEYPVLAKDLLKNISDEELTKEQRELKAKMLARVNEVSASAKTLDSIVEARANVISLLVKSASKEGISNSDYAQLITKFKDAYDIDLNIDFTKTDNGYNTTVAQIMQQYDTIKNKSASDVKQFLKLIGDSIDISDMTAEEVKGYQNVLAQKYQEAIDKNLSPEVVEQLYDLKIKAIEDNNARVRENTERQMKFTSGAEKDATDALVFFVNDTFAGTLDQLEALANSSEIDLTDILNNATWDSELQQFIVSNKNAIKGIDWDNIENIGVMVADSVREVSQQMTDLLSKAQSGDITYDEFNKLNVYLRESGLNKISKDALQKTANGLVITYEALAKTYAEMVANGQEEAAKAVREMLKTRAEAGRNSISDILSGNFTNWNDYVLDNDMKARLQEVTGRSMAQAVQVLDESTDGLAYTTQEYITEFMKGLSNDLQWDKAFSFDNAVLTDKQIRADFETLSQMFTKEEFKALQPNIIIDDKNRGIINRDFLEQTLGKDVADRINTLLNAGAKTTAEQWQEGLEEDNARILKNINTNSRLTSGRAKEAIEQVGFVTKDIFTASADQLESLANALGIDMNAFLDNATWSEELQKYIVSDIHNIDGIDWSLIEGLDDFTKDSINDFFKSIVDAIKTGLSGSLTNVEATQLKGNLNALGLNNLELNFEQGLEGLRLSQESAIHLYNELRKVDKIQGELVFRELRTSLEESNDKYKTMTSLIVNIVDLQEKISQADKYNDAKVQQYKEELALAKEIAAIRATSEDSSFNFLDQDIPGAMNNPLNYVKNWSNAWNEFRDAAADNKAIDFSHFYNVIGEMNNLALASGQTLNFMGMTLDGSLEAWDAAVNKTIDALGTDADKNYGVLLSNFGESLSGGADAFASSADGAIHTMAQAQVQILDALIQVFEVIVAMENFEKVDINANDLLDFEEIFSDTSNLENAINYTEAYTNVVKELLSKLDQDSELYAAFEQVKIDGYTLNQIVTDAADGIKNVDISSQTLTALMSALYKTLQEGDFDPSNIAESLKTWILENPEGLSGQIDLGQFVLDFDYNVAITKNANGTYTTPGGQTFNDFNEAVQAAVQEEIDKNENDTNTAEADAEVKVEANTEPALTSTQQLVSDINDMSATIDVNADVSKALDELSKIVDKLDEISDSTVTIQAESDTSDGSSQATGNIAMAAGTRTLMGELGPELYVSNGRYHIAGENGAEFVNLPKDAIVFNHLQTQRLLSTGNTGRGRAITSETNAVALAKGGPAAANAQKTLATLKQLRAMWSRLAEASITDLAGAVNKEGGDKNRVGSWVADVERWYNLLQKIARLEKEINYQEALRSKIEADRVPNGIEYYQSQVDSLKNLREQAATQKLLADSYDEYFETRRKELNASPLSKFYEFNEAGQVQYKEGGLQQLASLFTLDDTGKARYTPKQQYDMLQSMELGEYMLRDSNGLAIERDNDNIDQFYYDSVQAAYERMTAEQQEMQDLYNNKEEAKVAYLEAITKADKLLQDIIDNQMDMEQKVLDAIETREQKIIDKMTKERQALADSSAKYFEGLEQALNKEREMYSRQQDQDSLAKLQRRLSILQRSGGSASEIASLQQEITDKQRDAYFEAQETAIQEAKDASDLQLEKMQEQIDLMTETLEYEKANGLLWGEVATILSGTSESIMEFITTNMPEWQAKSATAQNEELRTLRNSTQQWVAYYNDGNELVREMIGGVQGSVDNLALDQAKRWNEEIQKSSPLQLSSPAIDTQAAAIEAVYENSNNNTQIDKLEYNVNVKNIADAQETERLVQKAMMEGEEPWKNAFKRSPVNNSMCKRGYK